MQSMAITLPGSAREYILIYLFFDRLGIFPKINIIDSFYCCHL